MECNKNPVSRRTQTGKSHQLARRPRHSPAAITVETAPASARTGRIGSLSTGPRCYNGRSPARPLGVIRQAMVEGASEMPWPEFIRPHCVPCNRDAAYRTAHPKQERVRSWRGCSYAGDRRDVGSLSEGRQRSFPSSPASKSPKSWPQEGPARQPRAGAFGIAEPLMSWCGFVATRELCLATTPSGVPRELVGAHPPRNLFASTVLRRPWAATKEPALGRADTGAEI